MKDSNSYNVQNSELFDYFFGYFQNNKKAKYALIKETTVSKPYKYEGQILNLKKHGIGKLTFLKKNIVYKGQFKQDQYSGFGSEKSPNYCYHGHFTHNKRSGLGYYETSEGFYFGFWKNGLRYGLGTSVVYKKHVEEENWLSTEMEIQTLKLGL